MYNKVDISFLIFLTIVIVILNQLLGGYIIFVVIIVYLALLFLSKDPKDRLFLLLLVTIPLPIYVQIGERDIGTVTTLIIYGLFSLILLNGFSSKIEKKYIVFSFLIIIAFLISFSQVPEIALNSAIRRLISMVSNFLVFFIVVNFITDKYKFIFLYKYLIYVGVFSSIIVILGTLLPETLDLYKLFLSERKEIYSTFIFDEGVVRARSFIADYELSAELLTITLCLLLGVIYRKGIKFFDFILILIIFLGLIFTGTRAWVVLIILSQSIFWLLTILSKKFKHKIIFLPIVLTFLVLIIAYFFASNQIINFYYRLTSTEFRGIIPDTRLWVWGLYLIEIEKSIWIGYGYFRQVLANFSVADPHSLYLHLMFSVGLIGTVPFISFLITLLLNALKSLRSFSAKDEQLYYFMLSLTVSLMIFLIGQYKITFLREENYQTLIFLLFGLIVGGNNLLRNEQLLQSNINN